MSTANSDTRAEPVTRALVLGGGGPVGRAWEAGLAVGWQAQGLDLGGADLILGTSAGAIVGAEIALGLSLDDLGPITDSPADPAPGKLSPTGMQQIMAASARAATSRQPELAWQEVGQMALAAVTCSEDESLSRRTFAPLRGRPWAPNFRATSVGTSTGRFQVWSAASGAPLERAVAASSALPSVWPPITIGQDRYMDGGVRSALNADLAARHSRVVVVSCFALGGTGAQNAPAVTAGPSPQSEVESLRAGGSTVEVVTPNRVFLDLTGNGTRMLDNSLVPQAYEVGKRQAIEDGPRIRAAWLID